MEWRKHKKALPIIINCPDKIDVKAMCIWMKHVQSTEEQAEYWEKVEERMDGVGPIPRCIFNQLEYRIHLSAIEKAVKLIKPSNATDYMGVGSDKIWIAEDVSHKIVKVVRVREEPGIEVGYNAPVSRLAMVKITHRLTNMTPPVDVFSLLLRGYGFFFVGGFRAFRHGHVYESACRGYNTKKPHWATSRRTNNVAVFGIERQPSRSPHPQ
ncbi:hypothetical protein TcYC6_0019400 [Trypanosoma cruzi]|nr:hypothetical protein TcYC6_0019400 [Trypanosoma cruzi]